jgi:hypothetical protein
MSYWLVKSEPNAWSWEQHAAVGIEPWDGVRNHQVCNNMKAMKAGDRALFYHSGAERQVVGVPDWSARKPPRTSSIVVLASTPFVSSPLPSGWSGSKTRQIICYLRQTYLVFATKRGKLT